jgi:CheY-like chemotaxis protein
VCGVSTEPARILIIEDDPDLMRVMAHTLTSAGFQVIQAYGGEDALRKLRLHPPDLIVTDLAMPQMSGAEVIHHVKLDPATKHIPCIAITAFTWEHIAQSAKAVGCDSLLPKPFSGMRLRQEVAKYVPLPGQKTARSASST